MGGLGRRPRARARRLLPRPPGDRAGLVRAGLSGPARGRGGACSDRGRRMDQAPRDPDRRDRSPQGAYSERADGRRHGHRLCRRLCGLRGLRLHRPGGRVPAARRRGALHARRRAAARSRARRSRRGRRLCHAADRLDRGAELLGALSLPRHGHSRRLRSRPGEAVALARRRRRRGERAMGPAGHWRSCGADPARLPSRRRLHAGRASDRLGSLVRARRRARRDRLRVFGCARGLSLRLDAARAGDRP